MSYDRVICSKDFGGNKDSIDLSKVFYGELIASEKSIEDLIGKDKKFTSFLKLLEELNTKVDDTNSRVFIYCDKESYYKLAIKWLKIILPNCNDESAWKFFKSHVFKEKNFVNSRMSATSAFAEHVDEWLILEEQFKAYWAEEKVTSTIRKTYADFVNTIKDNIRVEFLLAAYLHDKSYGEILAKAISPLVKKDLEKFLYEHKEIILVHFQRPVFQQLLEVQNGPYTFDNFYDMVNDPAPLVQLMFKPEIWGETRSSMYAPSARGTIDYAGFTDENIENLKVYSKLTGQIWSDELWYTNLKTNKEYTQAYMRSEIDKFEFIKFFRDKDTLTVEELDQILEYEIYHQYHAAGSFYAIDLRTVNTYFVDFLLMNHDKPESLKPYTIKILDES
jgi:hypothetical protein